MPNLSALSRGTQLLAAAGVLLLLDTFLKWQNVDLGPISVGQNAWHGFWGVVMGLLLLVLLAWVIARIMEVDLPFDFPDGLVTLALGALVFLFALLKNLTDDYSTIWSYLGVLLAAAVAFGAWLRYQESGGTVDTLRSSMPSRQAGAGAPAAPADRAPGTQPETQAAPPTSPPPAVPPSSGDEPRPYGGTEPEPRSPESPSNPSGRT